MVNIYLPSLLYHISFFSDEGVIRAIAPFLGPTLTPSTLNSFSILVPKMTLLDTPYDWNYTVEPQRGMHGRTFSYPRGRLLGGSSSASEYLGIQHSILLLSHKIFADYIVHQYGSDEDWDRYAKVTGDPGWAWKNVKKYIKKVLVLFSTFYDSPFIPTPNF